MWHRVRGAKLSHAERCGHVGGEKTCAHGHGFVRVEVHVKLATIDGFSNLLLHSGHARAPADDFDSLDFVERDVERAERGHDFAQRTSHAFENIPGERSEFVASDFRSQVNFVVQ